MLSGRTTENQITAVHTDKAEDILSPDCRRKKNRAHNEYKKNIEMTECLVILYPA